MKSNLKYDWLKDSVNTQVEVIEVQVEEMKDKFLEQYAEVKTNCKEFRHNFVLLTKGSPE